MVCEAIAYIVELNSKFKKFSKRQITQKQKKRENNKNLKQKLRFRIIYRKVSFCKSSSASSRTKISTADPEKSPRENKSKILPGVPTKTCGRFRFNLRLFSTTDVPPILVFN